MDKPKLFIKSADDLNQLTYMQPFEYNCISCGKTCDIKGYRKNHIDNYKELLCPSCLRIKRYGYVSPFQDPEVADAIKKNNIEKYGVEYPLQSQEIHDKISESNLSKFGNKCTLHDGGECESKAKATFIEKYDVDSPLKNKEIYDKTRETFKSKTGVKYSWEDPETYNKVKETVQNRYGVDNIMKNKDFVEKAKNTCIDKYGTSCYLQSEDCCNKMIDRYGLPKPFEFGGEIIKSIMRDKYGEECYSKTSYFSETMHNLRITNPEIFESKEIYFNYLSFDSIPEFCVYLFCFYNGIPITRNYECFDYVDIKGKERHVYPDFVINNRYVELKGGQFINPDGTWTSPFKKKKVDDEWVDMTPEEYAYECSVYESKRQCLIRNGVIILKDSDPWVQMCIAWTYSLFGKLFILQFSKNTFENVSYGYNPFNCDQNKEYQDPIGLGATPFAK